MKNGTTGSRSRRGTDSIHPAGLGGPGRNRAARLIRGELSEGDSTVQAWFQVSDDSQLGDGMAAASTLAIEAQGLVKVFGRTRAVDGVDLAVPSGAVYGVLGPNGAGKTDYHRMLAPRQRMD